MVERASRSATPYSSKLIGSKPKRFLSAGTKIKSDVSASEKIIVPQRSGFWVFNLNIEPC